LEILSAIYLALFAILFGIQVAGMLIHRAYTYLHKTARVSIFPWEVEQAEPDVIMPAPRKNLAGKSLPAPGTYATDSTTGTNRSGSSSNPSTYNSNKSAGPGSLNKSPMVGNNNASAGNRSPMTPANLVAGNGTPRQHARSPSNPSAVPTATALPRSLPIISDKPASMMPGAPNRMRRVESNPSPAAAVPIPRAQAVAQTGRSPSLHVRAGSDGRTAHV
jgi:hypothetical protein